MCALRRGRTEDVRAREAAAWMRSRLIGALAGADGTRTAQAVLRRAAVTYGPQAARDALDIIHRDAVAGA
jgi:hypothetical protein